MGELQEFLIAFGGNQDEDPEKIINIINLSIFELESSGIVLDAISRFYRTPCFPKGAGNDYVNAAARFHSGEAAENVLENLHRVEARCGRERVQRWGTRSLDLDLIAAGNQVRPDAQIQKEWMDLPLEDQMKIAPEQLILPHPRIQDRAFVLVPLADVAPNWIHPLTGTSASEMLAALPEEQISEVVPL
ncbi:2-amino-4-hydroxy-6-hydroxymethyldihydropteridinepyrophosphokinase [Roseovarius albus]|uniref:2-amino-4-hydroxy-6-hydroxymethyldihydropteridine pyrophosphokinase n=1 Tax=Roseovarius albus TaxID=1247867 RepID=A0A1X6YIQ6_9RHOB|nr:2-amino-4-hydroxy-6-hydroxymethyldihydropteridine diphosphokinase [Roseovarius albus]SLN22836.1 2-amino-4-hydroxy-6-hydroxymethyldihydropteridinepyrophosphokinase [Roseovarius albus]